MALEGSLKEFNVADILQLIFFQKKTGSLILQGRSDKIRILFHDGNIVSADSRKRGFDKRLIWIMAKRGLITQEHLDAAIGKAKTEGGKFTHHLVKDGIVTTEDIQSIYTYLIHEIMARVFAMKEGKYEFKPQGIPVDKEVGVELNTEHFLMEGVRLIDEWTEIEGRIFLEDVYVRDEEAQSKLDEKEERIINYVDGVFDVADVADASGLDSFTAAFTMLQLEEKGVVYRLDIEEDTDAASKVKARPKPIPQLKVILGALMVIFFGLAITPYILSPKMTQHFNASEQLYKLRIELRATHAQTGKYPMSLSEMDPWGTPIKFKVTDNGFDLYSAGPDTIAGTEDDIH
jgi:hypothetical protein